MSKECSVQAYAKINLSLDVLGKLPNGYHEVKMVMQQVDLGSHMLFIGYPTDGEILNQVPSATYAYYFAHIKPKPQSQAPAPENKQLHHWVCRICGYVYEGETLPPDYVCPICKHPAADFDQID